MDAPERKDIGEQTVICIHHQGRFNDMPGLFGRLAAWAQVKGVEIAGPAIGIFLSPPAGDEKDSGEYEACLPVAGAPEGDDAVQVKTLPAATVAFVTVTGGYGDMTQRYTELFAWLSAQGQAPAGPPREVYLKHPEPGGVADPADLVTEIQVPIEE